ncbi:MAG: transposase [Bacillota bacterium]
MAYADLVPSEASSGGRRQRGSITKTGNAHVRRVTVEAAWHYRHAPRVGSSLSRQQKELPPGVTAIAWKAQHRLNLRYRRLMGRGKSKQWTVVSHRPGAFGVHLGGCPRNQPCGSHSDSSLNQRSWTERNQEISGCNGQRVSAATGRSNLGPPMCQGTSPMHASRAR